VVNDGAAGAVPGVHRLEELFHDCGEGLLLVAVGEIDGAHEGCLAADVFHGNAGVETLQLLDDVHVAHGRRPVQGRVVLGVDEPVRLEVGWRVGLDGWLLISR